MHSSEVLQRRKSIFKYLYLSLSRGLLVAQDTLPNARQVIIGKRVFLEAIDHLVQKGCYEVV